MSKLLKTPVTRELNTAANPKPPSVEKLREELTQALDEGAGKAGPAIALNVETEALHGRIENLKAPY